MGGNEAETPGGRNQNQNLSPKKDFHTNKECSLNYIFTVHFGELERWVYGRSKSNALLLKRKFLLFSMHTAVYLRHVLVGLGLLYKGASKDKGFFRTPDLS